MTTISEPPAYRRLSAPMLSAPRRIPDPSTPLISPAASLVGTTNPTIGAWLTAPMSAEDTAGWPVLSAVLMWSRSVKSIGGPV